MAVALKQMMNGMVTNTSVDSGSEPAEGKVWLVKDIRLVNTSTTASVSVKVEVVKPGPSYLLVSPQNLSLAPNQLYQDEGEFVVPYSDKLRITATGGGVAVHYLVSGIERDQET